MGDMKRKAILRTRLTVTFHGALLHLQGQHRSTLRRDYRHVAHGGDVDCDPEEVLRGESEWIDGHVSMPVQI